MDHTIIYLYGFILLLIMLMLVVGVIMMFLKIIKFDFNDDMKKKFKNYLVDVCEKEGIYLYYHDDIVELNRTVFGEEKKPENYAVGVYQYLKTIDVEYSKKHKYPRISLLKTSTLTGTSDLMVFAHEIGHHYGIKKYDNDSEEIADVISVNLFKKCFTKYDVFRYKHFLKIYSKKGLKEQLI